MSWSWKRTIILIMSVAMLYVVGVLYLYIFIDHIVFQPRHLAQNQSPVFTNSAKHVILSHPDKEVIDNYHFIQKAGTSKGCMIFFHGYKGNIDDWNAYIDYFYDQGYDVFAPEYRGYGRSAYNSSEIHMYEDATLAMAYVRKQYREDSILVYGVDIGAVVAAYTNMSIPNRMTVLENPVYGIKNWLYKKFPALWLHLELKYDFIIQEYLPNAISPTFILASKKNEFATQSELNQMRNQLKDRNKFSWIDQTNIENDKQFPPIEQLNLILSYE
ncbi:MAG: alpha/beta hydrolase [Saprospiraceae bacterium]|jgi:esterase/lipase|nr:alpha/beta hydrolase [Saprospiraceae bacterium]MBK7797019.1 alpha/beta hydrolase [Saprospiraceae bacterium]MBK9377505.1 alpha/beta hydrolase [Saprospiraceae bacterium]